MTRPRQARNATTAANGLLGFISTGLENALHFPHLANDLLVLRCLVAKAGGGVEGRVEAQKALNATVTIAATVLRRTRSGHNRMQMVVQCGARLSRVGCTSRAIVRRCHRSARQPPRKATPTRAEYRRAFNANDTARWRSHANADDIQQPKVNFNVTAKTNQNDNKKNEKMKVTKEKKEKR